MPRKIKKPKPPKPIYLQVDMEAFARVFHFPEKEKPETSHDD